MMENWEFGLRIELGLLIRLTRGHGDQANRSHVACLGTKYVIDYFENSFSRA
jgi:hypothetical protein